MSYQFGVASTPGSYGKIQNYEENNTVQLSEIRDEDGEVSQVKKYDEQIECTFEYVFDGTAPSAGDEILATGGKIILTSVSTVEINNDWKRLKCSGKRYVANSIPA